MDLSSEKTQGHLRIEIRRTAKGEYSYDTTASVTANMEAPEDMTRMESNIITLLQDADEIARSEVERRHSLDQRGLAS